MFVYTSEFCNETYQTVWIDWDFDTFLDFYNNIAYMEELKNARAIDEDRERQQAQAHLGM